MAATAAWFSSRLASFLIAAIESQRSLIVVLVAAVDEEGNEGPGLRIENVELRTSFVLSYGKKLVESA